MFKFEACEEPGGCAGFRIRISGYIRDSPQRHQKAYFANFRASPCSTDNKKAEIRSRDFSAYYDTLSHPFGGPEGMDAQNGIWIMFIIFSHAPILAEIVYQQIRCNHIDCDNYFVISRLDSIDSNGDIIIDYKLGHLLLCSFGARFWQRKSAVSH